MRIPEPRVPKSIRVSSPRFAEAQPMPARYSCAGAGVSPPLVWTGVPAGTVSVALVVSDPDAPRGTFLHWLLYDLPPGDGGVDEGTVPEQAREGENSGRRVGWYPACPPSGTHRYVFSVYALSAAPTAGNTDHVLDEIARHATAWGSLTGTFSAVR